MTKAEIVRVGARWHVKDNHGEILYVGAESGAYAYLLGMAQEQINRLKIENERLMEERDGLKRRVEQIESTLNLATCIYTEASEDHG